MIAQSPSKPMRRAPQRQRRMVYSAPTVIPAADIASVVVTAIEGGSSYWCARYDIRAAVKARAAEAKIEERPLYSAGAFYLLAGWSIEFHHDGPDSEEGAADVKTALNYGRVIRALSLLADKYPAILARIVSENYDADDADVFLQLALMGEVIFG